MKIKLGTKLMEDEIENDFISYSLRLLTLEDEVLAAKQHEYRVYTRAINPNTLL